MFSSVLANLAAADFVHTLPASAEAFLPLVQAAFFPLVQAFLVASEGERFTNLPDLSQYFTSCVLTLPDLAQTLFW